VLDGGGETARVGPNAVIQTAEALAAHGGEALASRAFRAADCERMLVEPPTEMVPEDVAARLHRAVLDALPPAEADAVAADAGRRTAAYILAHRIPRPVQWLLRALPPRPAARMLTGAIGRHAWTFAGSGAFSGRPGNPVVLEIAGNPLALPGCPWHRAVFAGLYGALVSSRVRVRETACCACGASSCRYEIAY
jgi:divinyl protochlorophyllide a 8-vinyl-reductase